MTERLEPFRQALIDLRSRLREGALEPGSRVTAKEVADALKLSPTPVREALSRLAGEGLLEDRRGDGFFVPELSVVDVSALYRLSEQLLLMSQDDSGGPRREARPAALGEDHDPVRSVERLFVAWANEKSSRVTAEAYRTTAIRLAPVRRREHMLIPDLQAEADALWELALPIHRDRRPMAIEAFHRRRVVLAEALSELLPRSAHEGE